MAVYQLESFVIDATSDESLWHAFLEGLKSGPARPGEGVHKASVPSARVRDLTDRARVLEALTVVPTDAGEHEQVHRVAVNGHGIEGRLLICLVCAEHLQQFLHGFDWGSVQTVGVSVVVFVSLGDEIDRGALKPVANNGPVDCVVVHAGGRDRNGTSRFPELQQVAERVGQALYCIVVRQRDTPSPEYPLVTGGDFRDEHPGGVRHCSLGLQVLEFNPEEYAREVASLQVHDLSEPSGCKKHQRVQECNRFAHDRAVELAEKLRNDLKDELSLKYQPGVVVNAGLQFGDQVCFGVTGAAPSTHAEGRRAHQNWRQNVQFAYDYDRDLRVRRLIDVLRAAGKWQSSAHHEVAEHLRDVVGHVAAPDAADGRFGATPALLEGVVQEFSRVLDEQLSAAVVPERGRDKEWDVVSKSTVADDLDSLSKELERWPNRWTAISQGVLACALVAAVATGCWMNGGLSGLACVAVLAGSALVSLWAVLYCLSSAAARRDDAWRTVLRNSERRLELLLATEVQARINETRDLAREMSVRAVQASNMLSAACQNLCDHMRQPRSGHSGGPWMRVWPGRKTAGTVRPDIPREKVASELRKRALEHLQSMIERPVDWTLDGICRSLAQPLITNAAGQARGKIKSKLLEACASETALFWARVKQGEDIFWPAESSALRQGTGRVWRGRELAACLPNGWEAQVCVWDIGAPSATGRGGR